jgi:hypothetical protein
LGVGKAVIEKERGPERVPKFARAAAPGGRSRYRVYMCEDEVERDLQGFLAV